MTKFKEFMEMAERLDNLGSPTAKEGSEILFEAAVRLEELRKAEANKAPTPAFIGQSRSETTGKLAMALAKAQGIMSPAYRNRRNDFLHSDYADLVAVQEACRDALAANDLAYSQEPIQKGDMLTVVTTLMHSSGEWLRSSLEVRVEQTVSREGKKQSMLQAIGSALTYLRRYGLMAMVGVVAADDEQDDDGNAPGESEPRRDLPDDVGAAGKRKMIAQIAKRGRLEGTPVVLFGERKNKPLAEVTTEALQADLANGRAQVIAEPGAKWAPNIAQNLQQIEAEIARREEQERKKREASSKVDK